MLSVRKILGLTLVLAMFTGLLSGCGETGKDKNT